MNKANTYIIGGLAIIISVLAVASLSFAGGQKVQIPLVTKGIQALLGKDTLQQPEVLRVLTADDETLSELTAASGTAPSLTINRDEKPANQTIPMPLKWKNFEYNGFALELPADWTAVWPATEEAYATLLLQDKEGRTVATIVSPPPTTGYPGYKITEKERVIKNKESTFAVKYWHGDPEQEMNNRYLDTIIVSTVNHEDEIVNMFDPRNAMQIFSQYQNDVSEVFDKIYKSIEYKEKWNDYSGDVYSFQYPADWTVKEDAGVGHRWVEFYDENNKLTASMTCPIPKSDNTADEKYKSLRTFELTGIQYAFKHILGFDSGNNPGENTVTMEMVNPPQDLLGGISGTACQLTAGQTGLEKVFTRIHQSLTLKELTK